MGNILKQLEFWQEPIENLYKQMGASPSGLSEQEAEARMRQYGKNRLHAQNHHGGLFLFFSQFKSPLILLLMASALLSFFLHENKDAIIILIILLGSGFLSFLQERGAFQAVEKLIATVRIQARVERGGKTFEIPIEEVVPGDCVLLGAGDVVPADGRLLEALSCYVDEATLTGEAFHVEKQVGSVSLETPLRDRTNCLFMGSHVISGSAKMLVIATGVETEFGKVSKHLDKRPPMTAFERGIQHFGYMLMEVTLLLVIAIFAFNIYLQRPVLESFLFALALAVGLTPQLLPAIVSVNLAHGAKRMAKEKVIVKRLAAIENLGSMNVLCCDKTGTLTNGVITLNAAYDPEGSPSDETLLMAYLNASFHTGYENAIDRAILSDEKRDISGWKKLDELPYDFIRKRMSVLVTGTDGKLLITKGALSSVLSVCSKVGDRPIEACRSQLEALAEQYYAKGYRVLGIASRKIEADLASLSMETQMVFEGFLLFFDPPKAGVEEVIEKIHKEGIAIKIITGDHYLVAKYLADQLRLPDGEAKILRGEELHTISDEALPHVVQGKTIFAEVEPNQKERIILALRKAGCVVGYLGDGINDATALHTADVGLSVDSAADVVKEVAEIVLLEKDLSVLHRGMLEGRRTFANTMKYIFMATSANFGNMFSMAGASLFLPFLPLLPMQILLMNLMTDVPEMTIATDRVDRDALRHPVSWDLPFIRRFMVVFGLISSIFDYATFGVLLLFLQASKEEFRTGWFIESVISAAVIVLVVRTKLPFFQSRASRYLTLSVLGIVILTLLIPYTPLREVFQFAQLPLTFYWIIGALVILYIVCVEIAKKIFYKWSKNRNGRGR
ncbi:MAG: magnesium-translocating P-type ATPase [Verrucomicrobia bacterium]|nr:magnesium-translocating P-type ATPase [Verrucomicrobiota bacterium]